MHNGPHDPSPYVCVGALRPLSERPSAVGARRTGTPVPAMYAHGRKPKPQAADFDPVFDWLVGWFILALAIISYRSSSNGIVAFLSNVGDDACSRHCLEVGMLTSRKEGQRGQLSPYRQPHITCS